MKKLWAIVLVLVLSMPFGVSSQAQRASSDWELLGRTKVGFGVDRDVIRIGKSEDWYRNRSYRQLRISVSNTEVRFKSLKIVYLNGHVENVNLKRRIRPGRDFVVDLRGERSFLRQIEMVYSSRIGLSFGAGGVKLEPAVVSVYGERVRRKPPRGRNWNRISSVRIPANTDRVVFRDLRGEGRFGQIRVRVANGPVLVRQVRITFGNGDVQRAEINQRYATGDTVGPIDLSGRQRFIRSVAVTVRPSRSNRRRTLQLAAHENPGRQIERPTSRSIPRWVQLGAKRVNFRVDRDVINVGKDAAWHRSHRFRRLHFLVDDNSVRLIRLRLTYKNGYSERLPIDRNINAGGRLAIDLGGERSYIDRIRMVYKSRSGSNGRAVVRVFGEAAGSN
ncbi:MAG: hypothetical protein ACR2PA_08055 [Hyphomicrobiaceae bacterium]